jgi:hypothetical protein
MSHWVSPPEASSPAMFDLPFGQATQALPITFWSEAQIVASQLV